MRGRQYMPSILYFAGITFEDRGSRSMNTEDTRILSIDVLFLFDFGLVYRP